MNKLKSIMVTRKIGKNRGVARLWLEGKSLIEMGWKKGDRFNANFEGGILFYIKDKDGKRKVAGTDTRPIIDTNTDKLLIIGSVGETAIIVLDNQKITVEADMQSEDEAHLAFANEHLA